jgi:hypothetical protein
MKTVEVYATVSLSTGKTLISESAGITAHPI